VGRAGPKKVHRYSLEFKRTAVQLSQLRSVQVQTVAEALDIHPFMLSRWRKEMRDGTLRGHSPAPRVKPPRVRELKRLQSLGRGRKVSGTFSVVILPPPSLHTDLSEGVRHVLFDLRESRVLVPGPDFVHYC